MERISFENAKLFHEKGLYIGSDYYYDEHGILVDNEGAIYLNFLQPNLYEAVKYEDMCSYLFEHGLKISGDIELFELEFSHTLSLL